MDVSIIIVNYNTKALLKQCLESVFEKTQGIEFEVIVVDNASRDDSPQMLKEEFPQVRLIESAENVGFGRANNLGALYAKGDYLFLLNSDTILLNNAIKILAEFLDEHQDVGVCGGNLFNGKLEPTLSFARMFLASLEIDSFFCSLFTRMIYGKNLYFNHTDKPIHCAIIYGADMMIRKDLFNPG